MKLKTLKDLPGITIANVNRLRLKQEVIKHIKVFLVNVKELEKHWGGDVTATGKIKIIWEKIDWIKYFFNIVEEDLK